MALTDGLLKKIRNQALVVGIAALTVSGDCIPEIDPPSITYMNPSNECPADVDCYDISRYVFECLVKDIDEWKKSAYECNRINLPSVKVSVSGKEYTSL